MKNLVLLTFVTLLLSCNNVEKYRAGIEGLASRWTEIEKMVEEVSKSISGQQANYLNAVEAVTIDEKVLSKMKADDKMKFEEAKKTALSVGGSYNVVLEQTMKFVTEWSAKKSELDALTNGLASKKLPKDVDAQVAALTTYLDGVAPTIDGWKNALTTLDSAGNEKLAELKALAESMATAKK